MPVAPRRHDLGPVERDARGYFAPGNRVAYRASVVRMLAAGDGATLEDAVRAALERCEGRVTDAARSLGLYDRCHLWYYLRILGLGDLPRELRDRARRQLAGAA
jgi:hypothetical protein